MRRYHESLSHTKWDCKYHVVFIPKCRRKTLYGELRKYMGEVFRKLAAQKESRIEVAGDRLYQKKKCYPFGAGLRREEAEFCRAALLGARVFRVHHSGPR